MSGYRLAAGGARIDREKPIRFTFDGEAVSAYEGDTVASALIASGRRLVARGQVFAEELEASWGGHSLGL